MRAVNDPVTGTGIPINLFATAWSPPYWMKTNGNMTGGSMIGVAGDQYHKAWAKYYSQWITSYESVGIPVWAITPQNEPLGTVWWDSCYVCGMWDVGCGTWDVGRGTGDSDAAVSSCFQWIDRGLCWCVCVYHLV